MSRLHRRAAGVARLLLPSLALLLACHRDGKPGLLNPGTVSTVVADSLVFTRADSTRITTGTTPLVCCGLYDPSFVNERTMRIVLYDPAYQKPGWEILVLIDRAVAGAITTLPTVVVAPSKVPRVSMFVADIGNELSSDAEDSSGTITVHSFQCTATAIRIDFSVDAILGSELASSPSMRVQGAFQATFPMSACP
jgi:hypothetical protein